jgi:hypothetical protein
MDYIKEIGLENVRENKNAQKLENKWKELNMGIDQWKQKHLYPFGAISPKSNEVQNQRAQSGNSPPRNHKVSQFGVNNIESSYKKLH